MTETSVHAPSPHVSQDDLVQEFLAGSKLAFDMLDILESDVHQGASRDCFVRFASRAIEVFFFSQFVEVILEGCLRL